MGRDDEDVSAEDDRTMTDHEPPSSARSKTLLFYKLVVASIVNDSKLKIPGKLVKSIEQELAIVVTLSVPDGRKWNMKLEKHCGKCCFGDGWVEFMKFYSVRVGHLLVFRYKGDSMFVVNVFNLSNAEILYSPVGSSDSEKVVAKKPNSGSKVTQSGNDVDNSQKNLGSVDFEEDNQWSPTNCKKGINGCKHKMVSVEVSEDVPNSMTKDKEAGNDNNKKNSGSEKIRQDTQRSENNDKEFAIANDVTRNRADSEKFEKDKLCSMTKDLKSVNEDDQKKSGLPPPGFTPKYFPQTPEVEKETKPSGAAGLRGSFALVKDVTPGYYKANVMSCKKIKKTRIRKVKTGQPKNQGNDHLGCVPEGEKLNSSGKEEQTMDMETHLSKMAINAPVAYMVSKAPQSEGNVISRMGTIADEVDKQLLVPEQLSSETQLPKYGMHLPPMGKVVDSSIEVSKKDQLGTRLAAAEVIEKLPPKDELIYANSTSQAVTCTSVKRKKELNTANLPSMPTPVLVNHTGSASTADILTCTKDARVPKKQKTVQLSAISHINPYCMVPVRACHRRLVHVPCDFASKYLKGTSGYATLQNLEGKQWKVRLLPSNGHIKLSKGWRRFAIDNYLKEGDICMYELVDSLNILLKVTVIRSPKEPPIADQEVLRL